MFLPGDPIWVLENAIRNDNHGTAWCRSCAMKHCSISKSAAQKKESTATIAQHDKVQNASITGGK
jgi:hypothetical protein